MRKLFTLFVLLLCLKNAKAQYVTIPDPVFVSWLQSNVSIAMVGNQMDTTSLAVTTRTNMNVYNSGINDLNGVQYFDSLKELDCSHNFISTITILPNHLIQLRCTHNQINNLPTLPLSLKRLYCSSNPINSLSNLPSTLYELQCNNNQLSILPFLPDSLKSLECIDNQLTNLPTLPNYLTHLACNSNSITNLPLLPSSLQDLHCSANQLTSLPVLPASLIILDCSSNYIHCFDPFRNISYFNISNNPFSCIPNYIPSMNASTLNYPLCAAGNPFGCPPSFGIVGFTYIDSNINCLKDNGDFGMRNVPMKIYSNTSALLKTTYTAINGVYQFLDSANTYTIMIDTVGKPFKAACIYPGIDSTITVNVLDTNINFALECKPGFDVGVQSIGANGWVFPGQPHTLTVNAGDMSHWYNLNCATGIGGTVSFSVNGPVTYMGPSVGSLTPSVASNVYTYAITDFGTINNTSDFSLNFITNTTAQAGDYICINATVTPIGGNNNPSNNVYTYCYQVVNSYDPNIKEVYPVDVTPGFNDWLTYTIHFQNTGNAPAFNIRLLDTLDAKLDLETFQVINYSHQNTIDLTGNILNVRFPNIMLPDSTSNPSGSIGFVQYRVKPKATWAAPYKIKNTAYIYFDYNAPIVTNTTYNSILTVTGLNNQTETLATLYPNPTNGTFTIELNTKEKQSLQVFDISSQMVLSQTIDNGKATIDANYLAAGIYNISIKGSGVVINKKLVVVK